jgi:GxxExxY protein
MLYEELSERIIGAAMEVRKLLGSGFLESVYEHAPVLELTARKILFERQAPITVLYTRLRSGNTERTSLLTERSYRKSRPQAVL